MYPLARSIFVLGVLVLPLTAQDQDPTSKPEPKSVIGRGPLFTLQVAGPKAMQQAVLPTNLGTMLASPECKPVRNVWQLVLAGILQEARAENAEEAWAALQSRLLGYAGRLDVEFHVTRREVVRNNWVRYDVAGHMLLWPDGTTDMGKLAQEARAFLVAVSGETPDSTELEDGRVCEFFGRANDDGMSLPMKHGEKGEALVLFFGSRIGKAISGGLKRVAASSEAHALRNRAWRKTHGQLARLDVDMAQVAELMDDEFRRQETWRELMRKFFGTRSWEWAGASIRTAGPQILIEATMDFKPGVDRGFFGAVLPDITTVPKLGFLAPHGTEEKPAAFVAAHIRMDRLYNIFLETVGNIFRHKPRSLEEIKAEVQKEMGFDMEKELLAHLDTGVLGLWAIDDEADEGEGRRRPDGNGLCFVARITNEEAFAATYKKLKALPDVRGAMAYEIEGGEVVPMRGMTGFGRTGKLFFFAVGDRGVEAMKTLLRENKAGDQRALPKIVQRTVRNTPPGWNGVGVWPTRWLRDPVCGEVLWEIWKEIDDIFPREVRRGMTREMLMAGADKAAPILQKYRLDRMVLFRGWEPKAKGAPDRSRTRLRLLW
jgi:hypothetical protein